MEIGEIARPVERRKLPRFLPEQKSSTTPRQPTEDFPVLKDHQILLMAKGNGVFAEWAKFAAQSLGLKLPEPSPGIDLGDHLEELLIVPVGYDLDSRRPTVDFPELDGDQIIAMAKGQGLYVEWAKWAVNEFDL